MTDKPSILMKKRLNIWICLPVFILLIYITSEIYKVSIIEGDKWKSLANSQQLKSSVVSASRGTVYDSNGTVLAQSATVYTIYCDPIMFRDQRKAEDDRIEELKSLIKEEDDKDKVKTYEEKLKNAKSGDEILDEMVEFLAGKLKLDTDTVRKKLTNTNTQ